MFGDLCNVLYLLDNVFNARIMPYGLDLWMVHVGRFALKFAHFALI